MRPRRRSASRRATPRRPVPRRATPRAATCHARTPVWVTPRWPSRAALSSPRLTRRSSGCAPRLRDALKICPLCSCSHGKRTSSPSLVLSGGSVEVSHMSEGVQDSHSGSSTAAKEAWELGVTLAKPAGAPLGAAAWTKDSRIRWLRRVSSHGGAGAARKDLLGVAPLTRAATAGGRPTGGATAAEAPRLRSAADDGMVLERKDWAIGSTTAAAGWTVAAAGGGRRTKGECRRAMGGGQGVDVTKTQRHKDTARSH